MSLLEVNGSKLYDLLKFSFGVYYLLQGVFIIQLKFFLL